MHRASGARLHGSGLEAARACRCSSWELMLKRSDSVTLLAMLQRAGASPEVLKQLPYGLLPSLIAGLAPGPHTLLRFSLHIQSPGSEGREECGRSHEQRAPAGECCKRLSDLVTHSPSYRGLGAHACCVTRSCRAEHSPARGCCAACPPRPDRACAAAHTALPYRPAGPPPGRAGRAGAGACCSAHPGRSLTLRTPL